MRELLQDLAEVGAPDADELSNERLIRHAAERIITQLVDLAVSVNSHITASTLGQVAPTYRESFGLAAKAGALPAELAERLAPSAGLRNILTHEYVAVDLSIVASAIPLVRSSFSEYVSAIARYIAAR